jgi:hypothetical protein
VYPFTPVERGDEMLFMFFESLPCRTIIGRRPS